MELDQLLLQLEKFGVEHDRVKTKREERFRNISRDMGQFLFTLVKGCNRKKILEIGTSNGFSTLWLASAAKENGGTVTTVELSSDRISQALENFKLANFTNQIDIHHQEAGAFLEVQPPKLYDFIFLDAERTQYVWWWENIKRILMPGGLIVIDNAISHEEELQPFFRLIKEDETFKGVLVPLGTGAYFVRKESDSGVEKTQS
ncbi:methyltransferase [Bacillus manliponensis]|uniref:Methyltransferase n=1 Tax=Bacillus manliponensis TaxID=574376 RepID=A0A073JSY5_9BACI|nr:O-methyltransferase [Bacillus manliponensis]KEK18194.1 methyltransferase [Bacillus manliponensis]